MADIDIEKKSAKWPWVLLGLLILIVVLFFVFDDDQEDNEVVENEDRVEQRDDSSENLIGIDENVAAVASLASLVGDGQGRMGVDHDYTHRVLTQLVDATQQMADAIDYNIDAQMQQANAMADSVQAGPYTTDHANEISRALMPISTALENMQEAHYPSLSSEIEGLRETSDSLNTEEMTLNQKTIVTSFFQKSANILNEMN